MRSPDIAVELPNGTRMDVPAEMTPLEFARHIGPGLATTALCAEREQKIPCILVVGDRERQGHTITVRRSSHKDQQTVGVGEFSSTLEEEIRTRGIS